MRLINEEQLDFDDVMIMPRRSSLNSRSEVDIFRVYNYNLNSKSNAVTQGIPVCCANMGPIGTPKMAAIFAKNGMFCALEKHIPVEQIVELYKFSTNLDPTELRRIFVSIGITDSLDNFKKIKQNLGYDVPGVNIDVPNGYCPKLIDRIKEIRDLFPSSFIIAGNVVTSDACQDIISSGANCAKVGIGSGQQCLTRLKTGVGRPQFSTIVECADACHQMDAFCMSDGGCSSPGDICKALCAGADFVMCGSIFGGAEETDSPVKIDLNGHACKQFYGMSSKLAQEKHFGGMKAYRSSEGREKWIPFTGPLVNTIEDICGSIRSCMTYIGARKIKNMSRQAAFYKVRHQLNTKYENCENI